MRGYEGIHRGIEGYIGVSCIGNTTRKSCSRLIHVSFRTLDVISTAIVCDFALG